jgi:tetratricopeptide (TPR) repeat protein
VNARGLGAETTLVVLLGASDWPKYAALGKSANFAASAEAVKNYLQEARALAVETMSETVPSHLLNLFDFSGEPSLVDEAISDFLRTHLTTSNIITDFIFYYVGHGLVNANGTQLLLSLKGTRESNPDISSYRVSDLATTLKDYAPRIRCYFILDCCFAAAAMPALMMSPPTQVITQKTKEAFADIPNRGIALLCASSATTPANATPDKPYTLFTGALLKALRTGEASRGEYLSLQDMSDLTWHYIVQDYPDERLKPRPELHVPDGRHGNITRLGLFKNPAYQAGAVSGRTRHLEANNKDRVPVYQASVTPNNLPEQETLFIGRDTERLELAGWLTSTDQGTRLLTLVGLGGVGKTLLALQVAKDLLLSTAFEGVFFIRLEDIQTKEGIALKIANELAVPNVQQETALEQLSTYIADKRLLLILDNYEHLLAYTDVITTLLETCEGLSLLVTSRQPLELAAEKLYVLNGLSVPEPSVEFERAKSDEALRLFAEIAKRNDPKFELTPETFETVRSICEQVDGVPLAIILAAAWIQSLSLEAIVKEIQTGLALFETNSGEVAEKHQRLQGVFETSWKLLAPKLQTVLTKLAVFRDGFELEAARKVADFNLSHLPTLLNTGFLQIVTRDRYSLKVQLKHFCTHKLESLPKLAKEVRAAHSSYYRIQAQKYAAELHDVNMRDSLVFFQKESGNLQSAWEKENDAKDLYDFVLALRTYQERWGLWEEQRELVEKAIGAAKDEGNLPELAQLLSVLASVYNNKGLLPKAEEKLREALEYQEDETSATKAEILNELGGVYYLRGEFEEALEYFSQALKIYQLLGDHEEALVLNNMGAVHYEQGHLQQATQLWEQALELQRQARDVSQRALLLSNLGNVYSITGEFERALINFETAQALYNELHDKVSKASLQVAASTIHLQRGEYQKAKEILESTLTEQETYDDQRGRAISLNNLAMVYERLGQLSTAENYLNQARMLQGTFEDNLNLTTTLTNLSIVVLQQGNVERAKEWARQALAASEETHNPVAKAYALNFLGQALLEKDEFKEAEKNIQEAIAIQQHLPDNPGLALSYNTMAELYWRSQDDTKAASLARDAMKLAELLGLKPEERRAKRLLAKLQQKAGQVEECKVLLEEVVELGQYLQHPQLAEDQQWLNELQKLVGKEAKVKEPIVTP